jgi:hypothetical protein
MTACQHCFVCPYVEALLTSDQQGAVFGWVGIVFGCGEGGDGGAEIGGNGDGDAGMFGRGRTVDTQQWHYNVVVP